MKKTLTLAVLGATAAVAFTSCTVVEPVPATTSTTTTHETTTVARPASTQTTTTRTSGGY